MKWRRINYVLHRDIGYLCIGLTLIYAISGVVLNHISHQFNPSYNIKKSETYIKPFPAGTEPDMTLVDDILSQLNETGAFKNVAMLSPGNIRIFVEGNTLDVQLATGKTLQEKVTRRPLLFEVNYLHLNKAKGVWTYLADIYCVLLGLLAITGFLMIRGKVKTRGIILTLLGFIIPIIFLTYSL
ncbi:MAG: PepSY-associated TM helix domain-containing protein [Desulfobulbaceae bacterium]|uniref:PepSY-associated TM helix domain-containing protein n=1 Tax=Candidatus Desulfobia pelagia TaxID=2841692 RepID=A0A8J6N9I3_9BACT|nr:PepSY-associated TM helix domain-containing protein [Candidatus Desulfobia pelagia]